jgi:hypothetical protein
MLQMRNNGRCIDGLIGGEMSIEISEETKQVMMAYVEARLSEKKTVLSPYQVRVNLAGIAKCRAALGVSLTKVKAE